MDEVVLQSIIGTDKKNPYLHVCRRRDSNQLDVFYGAQHLETVVDNKEHISYRAAVGRLYNAGLNRKALSMVFEVDRKTLQRWGLALLMPDAESSIKALRSRSAPRKLTIEVRRFAEIRFGHIYPHNRSCYSSQIRREIFETFDLHISAESLRPIFAACKQRLTANKSTSDQSDSGCKDDDSESDADEEYEQCEAIENSGDTTDVCLNATNTIDQYKSPSDSEENPTVKYVHHAGVLIFSQWLSQLQDLPDHGGLLKQWLALVLLKAVNIEQSKYLNRDSLSMFLGHTIPGTVEQRSKLEDIASSGDATKMILGVNAKIADVSNCSDYYYDPHTKHYTGMRKLLKGWCSTMRWADKALHSDFIHTSDGMPVFIEYADNYLDLRERFAGVVKNFREAAAIETDRKITMVIDRGIFGIEVFQAVKRDPTLELISWEKGYLAGDFDMGKCNGQFEFTRPRNHKNDLRLYKFAYMDGLWTRDPTMRRLVVRATNPKGTSVEVSVLSTDLNREAQELIKLIFHRWVQENDFKYLEKHYGINQITSYATIKYEELCGVIDDKQEENAQRKALLVQRRELEEQLKKLLHKDHKRKNRIIGLEKAIAAIEEQTSDKEYDGSLRKESVKLKTQLTRNKAVDITGEKQYYDQQIESITIQMGSCCEMVSKLDRLVEQGYERLDVQKKSVMDSIKILARNLFYKVISPFKKAYDNNRDDHEYFRQLTHAPGLWVETAGCITVYLQPAPYFPPKVERCILEFLEGLQNVPLVLPDGSGRTVVLKLGPPEGFELAIA